MNKIKIALFLLFFFVSISVMAGHFTCSGKNLVPKKIVAKYAFGKEGAGLGEFSSPAGLSIKDNILYVADAGNHRIQALHIQPEGGIDAKFSFGKWGSKLGEFRGIDSLIVREKYLFTYGSMMLQVLEINAAGALNPKYVYGTLDINWDGDITNPRYNYVLGESGIDLGISGWGTLAVKDNYLYVAGGDDSRIHILAIHPDGRISLKSVFGKERKGKEGYWGPIKKNMGKGEFLGPIGVSIKGRYLFVSDSLNHRIQVLEIRDDGSLSAKHVFGREGRGLGEFRFPYPSVIKDDYLYVSDADNSRIQVLRINRNGSLSPQFVFGKHGTGLGEFSKITGLAVHGNYLYVSDIDNHRLQVLEIQY